MENLQGSDFSSKEFQELLTNLSKGGPVGDMGAGLSFSPGGEGGSDENMQANMAKTLQMLSENAKSMDGMEPAAAEGMGEEIMKKMMEDFEKMGEKEDFQSVIDGMMKQLLSKEIMYDPIKAICDRVGARACACRVCLCL